MSARDKLYAYAGTPSVLPKSMLDEALDDYRAEVAAETRRQDAARLLDERAAHVSRAIFCDGITHAANRLDQWAGEKATATAATATPGLTERQQRLLDAVRTHGGEWTTRRVLHLFALTDPGVVQRGTARRDLAALQRAGHLVLVDDPDNRHYALHTRKGGQP